MNNKKFCIANLKMYLNQNEIDKYIINIKKFNDFTHINVVFCPPNTALNKFNDIIDIGNISYGSQNISKYIKGGYTGEVSLKMIKEIGCKYVIVGHSERRTLFNESNEDVACKFKLVYESNLTPILCIGENQAERSNNKAEEVLYEQINSTLNEHSVINKDIIIAYEPVWAIGTGVSADTKVISSTHNIIKNILKKYRLNNCNIFLLYGGSVNEINAQPIAELDNVDGYLIGSASTNSETFYKICTKL